MRAIRRFFLRLYTFFRGRKAEEDLAREIRSHLALLEDKFVAQGMRAEDARAAALRAFGGVEQAKERQREARTFRWLDNSWLDFKLGARMLVKQPGLALVGGVGMAVAIAIGALSFEVITEVLSTSLPLDDGVRVVALRYAPDDSGNPKRRALHPFLTWRDEIVSVGQLSAFRTVYHNLVAANGAPEPIKVAEITASGFALARMSPLLGRHLLPTDEREGAAPVLVIGYQAWQSRFGGDSRIVGRVIRLGGIPYTVVGVMPEGFRFPVDHQFWISLPAARLQDAALPNTELHMFGRLAPGVTWEEAQAELTAVGQRSAAAHPETHRWLRPVVLPYTREHLDLSQPAMVWALRVAQLLIGALLLVVAVNLAILMYARMVTRLGEIAVRTALGASRRRILVQLFFEALALSLIAAAGGLLLSSTALGRIQALMPANGSVPFWLDFKLSAGTVIYALGLAVLAAVITGVLPGLKATGRNLNANMLQFTSRSGTRLGAMWTALVIAQVAVVVALLPAAVYLSWQIVRMEVAGPGFAAERFVVGTVTLGYDASAADANRVKLRQLGLISRLEAEPEVQAVTFSSSVPGFAPGRRIEFEEGVPLRRPGTHEVSTLDVSVEMFEIYGARILAGRAFDAGDLGAAHSVVVNRTFVQKFLESGDALGLRFRYSVAGSQQPGAQAQQVWHQIVGVVSDFPSFSPAPGSDGEPTVYHPAAPGEVHPAVLSVRFGGGIPAGFIQRFREIGAEVDPALQLRRVVPLSSFYNDVRSFWRHLAWGIGLVTTSVLLLSAAGIYALVSFTVAQRTREMAIRAVLGGAPHRLLLSTLRRVVRQLALGLLVGSLLSGAVLLNTGLSVGRATTLLLSVAAIMLAVGLLAALGPARRGLRIQPMDALRAD